MYGASSFPTVSTGFTSDSKAVIPVSSVGTINKMSPFDSMKEVFFDIRDGISDLSSVFSSRISGLNSHLAFRLETLNTTMTTIGKILAKDLDIEKDTFDEMQENERQDERDESLGKDGKGEDKNKKGMGGGLLDKIKGAFGSLIDFLRPDSDLAKVGLAGLLVASTLIFRDKIAKAFEGVFRYINDLKETFEEEGMTGVLDKLKDDFVTHIANPSLGVLGLQIGADGKIGRIPGSFLDFVDPFTGPTNIFKTIRSLWTGYDEYNNNKKIYPDWYYITPSEALSGVISAAKAGGDMLTNTIESLWKGEWNGEPFLPEWMIMPINEMSWYKSTAGFVETLMNDPKATLKAIWEGKDPATGKSFLPEWMTTPIAEMDWFKDTMKLVDDSMDSVAKFIYNQDTGAILGIDFAKLSDLLPDITDIAKALYFSLPKWARFDTELEQQGDENIESLKESGAFNKELYGDSIINRGKIKEATIDELRTLLDRESDDLSKEDINFIRNTINEKVEAEKVLKNSITNNDSRIIKYESLTKFANARSAMTNQPNYTNIISSDNNSSNNYSQIDQNNFNQRPDALDGPTRAIEQAMKTG